MSNELTQNENSTINFFNNGSIPKEIKLCSAAVFEGANLQFDKVPGKEQTMVQFYLFKKGEIPTMGSFTIGVDESMGELNFKTTAQSLSLGDIFDSEVALSDEAIIEKLATKYSSNLGLSQKGLEEYNANFVESRISSLISHCKEYSTEVSFEISNELWSAYKHFERELDPSKKKQVTNEVPVVESMVSTQPAGV